MDESEHHKEVYAYFGITAHAAQMLERQIALTLNSVCTVDGTVTRDQYDISLMQDFKKTLGQLHSKLKKELNVSDDIKAEIEAALAKRNFLMHNYFWERAVEFTKPEGRDTMIHELEEMRQLFTSVDSKLTALTRAWRIKRGVTDEDVEREKQNLLEGKASPF